MKKCAEFINCKVKLNKLFYPKDTEVCDCWISGICTVLEVFNDNTIIPKTIKVCGTVHELEYNVEYMLVANLKEDKTYGNQYDIISMQRPVDFSDPIEQRNFLEMVLTDSQINKLYENVNENINPFDLIAEGDIQTLTNIKGIGEKTAKKIINAYRGNVDHAEVYSIVSEFGGTKKQADRLIKAYEDKGGDVVLIDKINTNPYILIQEVKGIGWKKADDIALKRGLPKNSLERVKAYIRHYFNTIAENGNVYSTAKEILENTFTELEIVDTDVFKEALYSLKEDKYLTWNEDKSKIYPVYLYNLENQIAKELIRILYGTNKCLIDNIQEKLKPIEDKQGWQFTEEQVSAIEQIINNQVIIVTGYGGTGKSSIVNGALSIAEGLDYAQCALSGRAAARLSEITGKEGMTIHRLLEFNPEKGFNRDESNPLNRDIIILDEVSMVGASLFLRLLKAIRTGTKLIMIGDDGQLESIGLCNIFKDMLDSKIIPVCRLTKIHRQASKSAIITESIKVRQHTQLTEPLWVGEEIRGELQDLKLNVFNNSDLTQKKIVDEFKSLYNRHPYIQNIQVVVPQKYRGSICTYELNKILQEYVNPAKQGKAELKIKIPNEKDKYYTLRLGDKVLVNRNNYEAMTPEGKTCPIFNGNQGIIKNIDLKTKSLIVDLEQQGEVVIDVANLNTIELAYSLTCHKLQGSEYKYVIVGLDFSAITMLTKEWLYTAITRASKKCVVCAETKALQYAIRTSHIPHKRTLLKELLIKAQEDFYNDI